MSCIMPCLSDFEAKKNAITWDFDNMMQWFKVELTYTSNAIEGSTFTRQETTVVLTQDIVVEGKSLHEHMEVVNHGQAFDYVMNLYPHIQTGIQEEHILAIHAHILHGAKEAGQYRQVPVRITGSTVILPNYAKVPLLMQSFVASMQNSQKHPVDLAIDAHYSLVTIHPFIDGNGRTARLLMNLILLAAGFPPLIVRKEDRLAYIQSLETAQLTGDMTFYQTFMYDSFDQTLDMCLQS